MQCPVCEAGESSHFIKTDDRDYWRCPQCEATYLDATQLPEQDHEHAQYRLHQNEVDDPNYRAFLSKLATPLIEKLTTPSNGLDYGCGPGPALAAMLGEAGHQMTVYDPLFFPESKALSRQYDFITCTEVVEHLHKPAQEFARLNQLLKPGGWLGIMTTLQTDDAAFANWHYRRDPTHVVFYRMSTLEHIAKHYGWVCSSPGKNVVLMHKPGTAANIK